MAVETGKGMGRRYAGRQNCQDLLEDWDGGGGQQENGGIKNDSWVSAGSNWAEADVY